MAVNIRGLTKIKSQTQFGSLEPPVVNWDFLQSQSLTSFSRGSQATLFDSTGKLTYAPNNILTYSNDFSNAAWVKSNGILTTGVADPFGGTNASTWTSNSDSFSDIWQGPAIAPGIGAKLIYSLWIRRRTGSGVVKLRTPGLSDAQITISGTWTQVYWSGTTVTAGPYFLLRLETNGDAVDIYSATYSQVTYETTPRTQDQVITTSTAYYGPRYPYAYNGATWDAQGLLAEQAATNLATYSQDISNAAYNKRNLRSSSWLDVTTAPDGTTTADFMVPDATNGPHDFYRGDFIAASTKTVTSSVYLKASSSTYVWASVSDGTAVGANFNLATLQTSSASSGVTATIVDVGNGWRRCSITATTAGAKGIGVTVLSTDGSTGSFAGNNTDGIYVWGMQVEENSLPTSYIPTTTTSVTRNADGSLAFSAITQPTGLTFSRSSNAMQYDAAGSLTYAPINLLTQSNAFSSWSGTLSVSSGVADPFGGTSASTLTASAQQYLIRSFASADASTTYLSSFWVRRRTGSGRITLATPNNSLEVDITPTSSWQQFTARGLSSGTNAYAAITLYAAGDAVDVYGATLSAVTYENVPRPCDQVITTSSAYYGSRYDYDPVTRLPKGLLVEEGRTNYQTNSSTSTGWSNSGVAQNNNNVTAPNETTSATLLTAVAGNTTHVIFRQSTGSGTTTTISIYVKAVTHRYVLLNNWQSAGVNAGAVFDLQTGTVTETHGGVSGGTVAATSIASVGNGWYRISVTATFASLTTYSFGIGFAGAATGNSYDSNGDITFSANGTERFYVWGAQLETGAYPTSYIPTTTASVSRASDLATLTGFPLATLGSTNGSIFVEIGKMPTYAANPRILETNTQVPMYVVDNNRWDAYRGGSIFSSSDWITIGSGNSFTANTVRLGLSWSGSGSSGVANAGTVYSSASNIFSVAPSSAYIGSATNGTQFMNTNLRKLAIYNVRMTDAKLKEKSVVGAGF